MEELYKLNNHSKKFFTNWTELNGRFDPIYYSFNWSKFEGKYPLVKLNSVVLSMKSGIGAGKQDQADEHNGILQIRPTNIDEGGFLKYERNIYIPDSPSLDKLQVNDVLFNNTNSQELVGKTAILKKERILSFSNHITRIRVDEKQCIPDYLWIILNIFQENKVFYSICTNWNNQSGVSIDLLKSIKIPLPPQTIQQQIVELYQNYYLQKRDSDIKLLLDSIDPFLFKELGITYKKYNANKYGMYSLDSSNEKINSFCTYMSKLELRYDPQHYLPIYAEIETLISQSPYKQVKIRDISDNIQSGKAPDNFPQNGYHYLKVRNIKDGWIDWNTDKISDSDLDKQFVVNKGDILLVTMGAGSLGKATVYEDDIICQYDPKITRFQLNNSLINNYYFLYILRSNAFQKLLEKEIRGSTGMTILNSTDIEDILIPLPPLKKQEEIVKHIQDIRSKVQQLQCETNKILKNTKNKIECIIGINN